MQRERGYVGVLQEDYPRGFAECTTTERCARSYPRDEIAATIGTLGVTGAASESFSNRRRNGKCAEVKSRLRCKWSRAGERGCDASGHVLVRVAARQAVTCWCA